mmetsp:Transcript_6654/g.11623  ORF Transcript_6654/g.11623 Transcript_6654/m.11623 type:complete len:247 (+) Transcript_6654:65-805(+)
MITQCVNTLAEQFNFLRDQHVMQFLLLGLEDAGKTTLLYRLKIPQWKKNEITRELQHIKQDKKDPSYHYEELTGKSDTIPKYGVWDIPGNEHMKRMWPMFYKYIRISAVIFVVDASLPEQGQVPEKIAMMDEARRQMHFLLNEDELRRAAFILVLNTKKPVEERPSKPELNEREYEAAVIEMLGVKSIYKTQAERFYHVSMDCADATPNTSYPGDQTWTDILKRIKLIHGHFGEGSIVEKSADGVD